MLGSIIIGLLAGIAANYLMKTNRPWWQDIIVGILGSILGGWISSILFGVDLTSGFNLTTLIVSILGALLVLYIYGLITKRRA